MFIVVLALSTVWFTGFSKKNSADEESAALLEHETGGNNDTKASLGKSSYGSITMLNGQAADLEYEAEQLKKEQDRIKVVEKRLQAEGNWFTYGSRPTNPLRFI